MSLTRIVCAVAYQRRIGMTDLPRGTERGGATARKLVHGKAMGSTMF
jgi:hypothetical protein